MEQMVKGVLNAGELNIQDNLMFEMVTQGVMDTV